MSREFFQQPNDSRSIERYTHLLAWMFSSIKVERGSPTDREIVELPILCTGEQAYHRSKRVKNDDVIRFRNILPRAGLEFVGMSPDSMRQITRADRIRSGTNSSDNRVPYNFNFRLNCKVKTRAEAYQLIELMAVRFDPYVSITIRDNKLLNVNQNIIVEMLDSAYEDNWEGDFEEARDIQVPFDFTLKGYIYDTVQTTALIERIRINLSADGDGERDWIDISQAEE